jgi:predicted aspartyl protease
METATMGRVVVPATIENVHDLFEAHKGTIPGSEVRRLEVPDAVVDTAATTLSIPTRLIAPLGLLPLRPRQARTAAGTVTRQVYGTVRLTVQGRDCTCDVVELPDDCPVLIGQVPLELMDWVVDPSGRRLIGNPAHGGEQMIELY